MTSRLPAILIGGPPHAGKSVLFYSVTHALRQGGVRHHAIRACPDGEGNWSQEADQDMVEKIRVKLKGSWPEQYVQRICQDLEHRSLPLLVDMGGVPRDSQLCMFQECTHALLLTKVDKPEATQFWQGLIRQCNLELLAEIVSQLDSSVGESTSVVTARQPYLMGTMTNLIRADKPMARGALFEALVKQITKIFETAHPQDLERDIIEQAPTPVLNLYDIVPAGERWAPAMLPDLLKRVAAHTSLTVWGVAPAWVYGALAARSDTQPFYLHDPRLPLRWVQPLEVRLSEDLSPDLQVESCAIASDATHLSLVIPMQHLAYLRLEALPVPNVPADRGLVISGRLPFWLMTALVRVYKQAGVPWIALHYPQLNSAVVVHSRAEDHHPGMCVPLAR